MTAETPNKIVRSLAAQEILAAIVPWQGTVPERLHHGSPFVFDCFDVVKSSGIVWFTPSFENAAGMARSCTRQIHGGIAGVYSCQLELKRVAYFRDETDIWALGNRLTHESHERRIAFPAVREALLALGFDGVIDNYAGQGLKCPPSFGALTADSIVNLTYQEA